jgi:hypothetical protein
VSGYRGLEKKTVIVPENPMNKTRKKQNTGISGEKAGDDERVVNHRSMVPDHPSRLS